MTVGSTDSLDAETLAEVIRDELASELALEYTTPRKADAEHSHADSSKANGLLGYEPSALVSE